MGTTDCTICGQPPSRHNGLEKFCGMYATYRAPKPSMTGPSLSDELVDTVARALCEVSGQGWREKTERPSLGLPHDFDFDALNNHWRHKARAALSASGLLERDERMREALERINRGRLANPPHNFECLCSRCAMPPGDMREIARTTLSGEGVSEPARPNRV